MGNKGKETKGQENEEKESKVKDTNGKESKTKENNSKEKESKAKEENVKVRKVKEKKAKEIEEKDFKVQKSKEKKSMPKKIFKITFKIIETIITIVLIFVSAIIITQKVTNNEQSFLGYRIFRVQTGSMIPKYQVGDVILVKETDIDKIQVGDDVTYGGTTGLMQGRLVTHQVIEIETIDGEKAFHTKGIANLAEDPIVYGEQINGVVQTKLQILTGICNLLNNTYTVYFCAILPLTIYIFFVFIKPSRKERKKERK